MRPFVEGWYQGALPHLASFLYTWAFLLPKTLLFDRIEIAAHLEFVIFLATLAGIPPLVRWLIPGCGRVGASWAALFLFPGLLLYDSTLSLTNDHVAACFAIPILWGLVLCAHAGLFVWYWTHHQDRYLQALLPWMAAAVAAAIMLIWRTGREVRLALCALIGLQVLWGGDVYFLPTHVMPGGTSIKATVDLLSSGLRKDSKRFERLGAYYEVSHLLPADAKVLVHEDHIHLGLGRMSVSDWGGWQGGLSYGRTRSPRDLVERLHEMGVTHIVWRPGASKHWDSLAGDLRFFGLVGRFAQPVHPVAGLNVAPLPDPARVDPKENETVIYLGCDGTYEAGLYQFADLTVPALYPRDRLPAYPPPRQPLAELSSVEQALQGADYLVRQAGCPRAIVPGPSFVLAAYREATELWIKR